MIQRIRIYVNELFADAPQTKKANDLKDEVCSNLIDKFVDLTGHGMPEEEAYNAAIASIGDTDELKKMIRQDEQEDPKARKRGALFVSCAVGLYIISIIPLIVSDSAGFDPVYGLVAMFSICALATGLLIYYSMTRPKYHRSDDAMVEEFKEWKSSNNAQNEIIKSIKSIVWLIIVALYFILSFVFDAWGYSWVIFIIGAAVEKIITLSFKLKE